MRQTAQCAVIGDGEAQVTEAQPAVSFCHEGGPVRVFLVNRGNHRGRRSTDR